MIEPYIVIECRFLYLPMSFESAKNCRLIAIHRNDTCARNHDRIADFSRLFQRFLR